MDPIINPWLIYLAELANWVKLAGFMAAGIVLLGASIEYMDAGTGARSGPGTPTGSSYRCTILN